MSEEKGKDFLDIITEFAKANNKEVGLDELKDAFPEFYKDDSVLKKSEEAPLFDEPINVPKVAVQTVSQEEIDNLKEDVVEIKKTIDTQSTLLKQMQADIKSATPTVDEALLRQRIETFQMKHDALEAKIAWNAAAISEVKEVVVKEENDVEEEILVHEVVEPEHKKKKMAWWVPLLLIANLIILSLLLFFLWKQLQYPTSEASIKETKATTNTNASEAGSASARAAQLNAQLKTRESISNATDNDESSLNKTEGASVNKGNNNTAGNNAATVGTNSNTIGQSASRESKAAIKESVVANGNDRNSSTQTSNNISAAETAAAAKRLKQSQAKKAAARKAALAKKNIEARKQAAGAKKNLVTESKPLKQPTKATSAETSKEEAETEPTPAVMFK